MMHSSSYDDTDGHDASRPPRVAHMLCSGMSLFPLQAAQRLLQCFGYSGASIRLQSGRTVVVGSEIAQGGYSFVYRATDAFTGEVFALKKILAQTEDQQAAALNEIKIHKSFDHPNIMPLTDYGIVSEGVQHLEYYLLFPMMENGTLRHMTDDALSRCSSIPERQVLEMFLKICRAVAELHAHAPPLAHRDIKPENVLLSDGLEPILTDFGSVTVGDVTVSKRADALLLQEQAAQMSSMAYRAPELYDVPDHGSITSGTDVWSLGCLLYSMAFGYSPFECSFYGDNELRIIECTYLSVIGTIKFPSNCVYSPAFCDLIRWILTQDPNARPSVREVIDKLHFMST